MQCKGMDYACANEDAASPSANNDLIDMYFKYLVTCADPESFVRGGSTLTFFSFFTSFS